jgi:BirA family transcriptional regulator, biotin operon repressor / biotin---[acetyl-CoA-carboxylase] ligase
MYKSQSNSLFVGKNLICLPSCQSTNDYLAQLLQNQSLPEGSVVITDEQTAGRGQRGNTWVTSVGENLTFSIYLKPFFLNPMQQFDLNIAVALGVYDSLQYYLGDALKLKWPNDVFVDTQKIGGILIENVLKNSVIESSIVGIGLNINQLCFSVSMATSLKNITGKDWPLAYILHQVCQNIEVNYLKLKNGYIQQLRQRYTTVLYGLHQKRWFEADTEIFEGIIRGVTDFGLLKVEINQELRRFDLKEIRFLASPPLSL